ncbi:MAG: amidohydrolase family protein [Burkholderiales bacterium]
MLTPEELARVAPAESSIFPSPIPVQCVSSDEYMPCPQTEQQREFEARVKEYGSELARKQGVSRRRFFQSAAGMAAAFVAMNETYGPFYMVSRAEAATPEMANERAKSLKNQFIMDMHTHFLRDDTPIKTFVAQRATVGKLGWNSYLGEKEQTIDDLKFPNYFKEIFMDSDTKVACISGSYSVDPKYSFLTNDMKYAAREKVNKEAGTRRMFSHAIFTPGHQGWLDKVEEEQARLNPDSWKGYTIGDNTNKHLSKWPFRLDDEKIMYPFYEKLVKWSKDKPSLKNVCIHKGLFPPQIEAKFPHLLDYANVRDVGKAAKDWPQLNFVIYHSGWRWTGPNAPKAAWEHFEKTGRIEWVTDLAEIPGKYGVKNVYGDLGQLFAWTTTANPRLGAAVMGTLIKGLGADHVVWGTDAVWTGAPQWQIEALRRLEIPEDMQKKYGYKPLGAADGPVKNAIFGSSNARLYNVSSKQQAAIIVDRVAQIKETYELEGPGRTNMAYGYVNKNPA